MRLYTTEDGLWSGYINFLMRDSHGFLWFCTRDGLSRFDGYRFTNYRIGDRLAFQNFEYIFESHEGVFWTILEGVGLYRFNPGSLPTSPQRRQVNLAKDDGRLLLQAELVSSDSFGVLFQDRHGRLWAGGAGLFLIEEKAGRVSFREMNMNLPQAWKPSFTVSALVEGDDGSLWLGTNHGLLRRLPDGRTAQYIAHQSHGPDEVRSLLADQCGLIWSTHARGPQVLKPEPLSALAGLGAFNSHRVRVRRASFATSLPTSAGEAVDLVTLEPFAGRGKVTSVIYQQSNRQIWLVVKDRLVLFDGRQFRFVGRARGVLTGLIEDLDGDMWITTYLGGVARFSVRGLRSYGLDDGLGDPTIASIYEDRRNGEFHVLSAGWSISRLGDRRFTSVRPKIPDAFALWSSTLGLLDHTGQWWLLTSRGLYRFASVRHLKDLAHALPRLYTKLDGLPGQWGYCIFEDSRGDLWISVRDYEHNVNGLVQWRRSDETFHKLSEETGLPPGKSASSFAEDRAGNLWFGFYQGGLARYAAKRFTIFTSADGLPEGFITALHLDRLGRLWLTSSHGGLARIDDPIAPHPWFVRYTTREGLSSNNARALTEDFAGNVYIGTVRGLDRLTPATGKMRHYGLADGLAGDFVTAAYCDRKGNLWFGTINGLSRLDPQPEPVPAAPSIRIEGLRIAGVKQPLGEYGVSAIRGLELSAAQNNLQIDFSSLSMARAALLRYQYKLQGIDSDWSVPTDQRTVQYADLAPGNYRFVVRALDPVGLSSVSPASVDFRIFAPFWQRWWFLTLVAMAIGCAVTLLYRFRVAYLLELERVRTHIATDLHDDIGSSLAQIAVLSEVVRRQVDGSAAASGHLFTIASTSRELVDSLSDIVWSINPNRDNLNDLSNRMRRFASDLFTANDVEFRFDAQEQERPVKLYADVRRQVFLIFKESVHNIVRHSRCANVEVALRIQDHAIFLVIKDDGMGFDIAQAGHGHGLMNMTQRSKTMGATLKIASREGGGTVVSLKVPLGGTRRRTSS